MMVPLILALFLFDFDSHFTEETMRLDFFHTGTYNQETVSLDKILHDGPWSGNPSQPVDQLNRGAYRFEIHSKTGTLLYSRGFSSIFGEWQTTGEAKVRSATFHESIRFPWPKNHVLVKLFKRQSENVFVPIWNMELDPKNRQINRATRAKEENTRALLSNGDPKNKVDVVLLGDGYSRNDREKFFSDALRLIDSFFLEEPFKVRKSDFNFWGVFTPSANNGISRPHHGIYQRSMLETQYSSFDSERYILSTANKIIRDTSSTVPYDFTIILINENTYGGGGIFGLYSTCPVDSKQSKYLFIHEFGHHFAALADEYFTSDVAYEMEENLKHSEPWEPNITANPSRKNLKWAHLVAEDTPCPTPWPKKSYETLGQKVREQRNSLRKSHASEDDLDQLFSFQANEETSLFEQEAFYKKTGVFEGGGYYSNGIYRPSMDCIMFSRNPVGFCDVCQEAINQMIDLYTK